MGLDSGWLLDTVSFTIANLSFSTDASVSLWDGRSASTDGVTSSLGHADLWSDTTSLSGSGKVAVDGTARGCRWGRSSITSFPRIVENSVTAHVGGGDGGGSRDGGE